jgi:hypothetical protein
MEWTFIRTLSEQLKIVLLSTMKRMLTLITSTAIQSMEIFAEPKKVIMEMEMW